MKRLYLYIISIAAFLALPMAVLSACKPSGTAAEKESEQPAGPVRFAWLTDTHVSDPQGQAASDLRLCIRDMNEVTRPDFVIVTGDLTDFGSDEQLETVKSILDSLTMPYYVVPGNHDAKWSESGCNTFVKTFGYEQFDFTAGGYRFLGCASGPNMRMAPALIPRSDMVWLHGLKDCHKAIFVNHYPMDSSVLNYFDIRAELKRIDTRIVLGGHWHKNTVLDYDGIPGILGRSSLSSSKTPTGYNLGLIESDSLSVCERRVFPSSDVTLAPWYGRKLDKPDFIDPQNDKYGLPADYPWMRYDDNRHNEGWDISEAWSITEDSDIAAGFAEDRFKHLFYATCDGGVNGIDRNGKKIWNVQLPGRIFSTPTYHDGLVIVGCADNALYALSASNGETVWKVETEKSVLCSPAVLGNTVYFGASDGKFRAVDVRDGSEVWTFDGVEGFVEGRPWVDQEQVVFGAWDRKLYSLDSKTGKLMWVWTVDKGSKMYSPAATWPVKSCGHIFIAVPDRKTYVLDARTGKETYHLDGGREAVGMSQDGKTIFSKTMHNQAFAFKADASSARGAEIWRVSTGLSYDIAPTELKEFDGILLIPTDKGNLFAFDAKTGRQLWKYKISVAMVNPLAVTSGKKGAINIFASTMDGKIVRLDCKKK